MSVSRLVASSGRLWWSSSDRPALRSDVTEIRQESVVRMPKYGGMSAPAFRCRVCDFPISLLFASRRGRTVEIVCPYCESSAIWELEDELPERP